ncbi:LysR family transcriptional regulator [Thalassobaculum salexigens]|uniref:LysR family transcriptional regulator n=1 Tax=Thalassobaculum salexigens TaxID=455360 RepID=UPI000400A7A5|nr:LysR family transcriptional regulator [Thalassobaculum salexigens]
MIDHLTAMAVFARVAESGGFSRAAESLGISKSAVSKQVSRLEDRFGTRLLNRTTRRISLTEAGERVLEHSRRAIAEFEAAEAEVGAQRDTPSGLLRVSAGVSFGQTELAPELARFLDGCPDLSIDLVLNDRRVDLVEEGYDVALRIGELEDSSMMARRLGSVRSLTAAAPSYLARRGRPQTPADLSAHDCLGYSYLNGGGLWAFEGPPGQIRHKFKPRLMSNNGTALAAAAEQGLGVVQMPAFIIGDAVRAGRLEEILVEFRKPDVGIYAIYPAGRPLAAKVRAFIDFSVSVFGDGATIGAGR